MTNILTLLERWMQLRAVNSFIRVGQILCGMGLGWGVFVSVAVRIEGIPASIELFAGNNAFLGIVACVLGIVFLIIGAFLPVSDAKSAIVSLMGMPGVSNNIPDSAVGKPYSLYNPQPYSFTLSKTNPDDMVEKLNGYCRHVVDDQIINDARNGRVFFAGLARVPCLFAMGTLFRSASVPVEPLERYRNPDRWGRLGLFEETENRYCVEGEPKNLVSSNKEIAVAVSLTENILPEQIPMNLKEHCIHVGLDSGKKREAIPTLSELERFSKLFKGVIDSCSKEAKVIHLFISAQSSVVFNLGRGYQEGMHPQLIVYNYTPGEGYTWGIKIDNGYMSLEQVGQGL